MLLRDFLRRANGRRLCITRPMVVTIHLLSSKGWCLCSATLRHLCREPGGASFAAPLPANVQGERRGPTARRLRSRRRDGGTAFARPPCLAHFVFGEASPFLRSSIKRCGISKLASFEKRTMSPIISREISSLVMLSAIARVRRSFISLG
jgi:hypothetical protein